MAGINYFTTLNYRPIRLLGGRYALRWSVIGDVFHKYLLRGGTTTPSGLYARLCHVFLVVLIFTIRFHFEVIEVTCDERMVFCFELSSIWKYRSPSSVSSVIGSASLPAFEVGRCRCTNCWSDRPPRDRATIVGSPRRRRPTAKSNRSTGRRTMSNLPADFTVDVALASGL